MDSSWLGLDDFFSRSSRLSSRRSRISLDTASGVDGIKIDFGPGDLDFDTDAFRSSLLREFEDFPRTSGSKLSSKSVFSTRKPKEQSSNVTESAKTKTDAEFETTRELRLKLQNSQEENLKLQAVITDLTQVNKRWQKYNNDRQIYVQKLLNTIQDQQEQLNLIGERSYISSNGQSSSSSNDAEMDRLRAVEQRLKERVSILEFQVKAHRDDWEAELNEKKQALKDKEALEKKIAQLLAPTGERGENKMELYCQNCGKMADFDRSPPSRSSSRMYRTAVHLPCSSSRQSSTTSMSTNGDESQGSLQVHSQHETGNRDQAKVWNIKGEETSYSRCSTVPLVGAPVISATSTTHSSTSSLGVEAITVDPITVKSSVQIPIAKSSSVPERRTSALPERPRTSLEFFKPKHVPPVTVVNSAEQYDGVETFSAENVICLRCGEVFPPDMHLKFLNHFPKCQSNRTTKAIDRPSESGSKV